MVVGLGAGGQELGAEQSEMFFDLRGFSLNVKVVDCRHPGVTCCDMDCAVLDEL